MRHGKMGRKLGRDFSHRKSMMRSLTTALLTHGRIRTTVGRAKELSKLADHVVTLAKRGDLHARRQALGMVFDQKVVSRLFSQVGGWYGTRHGGYTRILKLETRPGDNAEMAFIELVDVDRTTLGPVKVVVPPKKAFKIKKKPKVEAAAKPAPTKAKVAAPKAAKKKKADPKG